VFDNTTDDHWPKPIMPCNGVTLLQGIITLHYYIITGHCYRA